MMVESQRSSSTMAITLFLWFTLAAIGLTAPAPTPPPTRAADLVYTEVVPTPAPKVLPQRGLKSDIKSLFSDVASDLSGFVESGILDFPHGFATGSAVEKSLGISEGDVKAQPTRVLNFPYVLNEDEAELGTDRT